MTAICLLSSLLLPKGTLHVSGHCQTGRRDKGRRPALTSTPLTWPLLLHIPGTGGSRLQSVTKRGCVHYLPKPVSVACSLPDKASCLFALWEQPLKPDRPEHSRWFFESCYPKKSSIDLGVEITISVPSQHTVGGGGGGGVAIIPPSSSITIPYGSQRKLAIENKNIHCTYQVLSDSPLAFSSRDLKETTFSCFLPVPPSS